jgi:16S rRNA (uracil1498-N3)-methyltransferase
MVTFPAGIAHQLSLVLRLQPGDHVLVLDNCDHQFEVELANVSNKSAIGRMIKEQPASGEPRVRITLFQSLTQREKFEWLLQKCTEVGVAAFVPVISSRSLVQRGAGSLDKQERWQRILREAAEQSGRGRIPLLSEPLRFADALQTACKDNSLALMLWEKEHTLSLRQALNSHPDAQKIAVFIGPEGGFSDEEAAAARQAGCQAVSLGQRILRMETAAIVAVALILNELGEMG